MIQKDFANKVVKIIQQNDNVIGLAAAGSWITNELDEYSDLDLVLITKEKIGGDKEKMMAYARSFGNFISGFTGEHVKEPRVLICLYDEPLLHVDIKFLTLDEFSDRVENPTILFDRDHQLTHIYNTTTAKWPMPDYQWIEDRIWTWVHYIASKAARGEYFECIDGLGMIRSWVLSPLLHIKNNRQPRGLRKVEMLLKPGDLEDLKQTFPENNKISIIQALEQTIRIYKELRNELFGKDIQLQNEAEEKSMKYFANLKQA